MLSPVCSCWNVRIISAWPGLNPSRRCWFHMRAGRPSLPSGVREAATNVTENEMFIDGLRQDILDIK
jgi:hypothetical protein